MAELENPKAAIAERKRALTPHRDALRAAFADVEAAMQADAAELADARADGTAVPILDYDDVAAGRVAAADAELVKKRGAVIVRGVFAADQARAWDAALEDYVTANGYFEAEKDPELDKYFSSLQAGKPQIFGIYWSQPQVAARQSAELAATRAWLNGLWTWPADGHIDGTRECTYADRVRMREAGDNTIGLAPHTDAGSVERWVDAGYQKVFADVFNGNWRDYDPWSAAHRDEAEEVESPAVCRAFRTFQGWTALSPQGPGDGTLQLVPNTRAMVYILLRAVMDDVAEDDLCGATIGRSLGVTAQWHPPLMDMLTTIPKVEPGDTVWWHPDVVHGVEAEHKGTTRSDVMYIGSAPDCPKNRRYLQTQLPKFMAGQSAPDFAAEDFEVGYAGRATVDDLTDLGRKQMGVDAWG